MTSEPRSVPEARPVARPARKLVGMASRPERLLAILAALMMAGFWMRARRRGAACMAVHALGAMALIQPLLGILTLLSGVWLPVAVLHQAGAAVICVLLVINLQRVRPRPARNIRQTAN